MPQKETGSVFIGKCPVCKDELIVGWLRDGVPTFSEMVMDEETKTMKPVAKQLVSTADVNGLASDKQTCSCGQLRVWFDMTKGRAVFDWDTDEPPVGNMNLH